MAWVGASRTGIARSGRGHPLGPGRVGEARESPGASGSDLGPEHALRPSARVERSQDLSSARAPEAVPQYQAIIRTLPVPAVLLG